MKRGIFLAFICGIMLVPVSYASGDLLINLSFSKKGNPVRFSGPKPFVPAVSINGSVAIDIAPYPEGIEKDRYNVECYLNEQMIYSTTGFRQEEPDKLDFKFTLDTTKYENGNYKLIINFWDAKGQSAIGIREIIINNEQE